MKVKSQQGYAYERNTVKVLQPLGLVPPRFKPAEYTSDRPDIILFHKKRQVGCELKMKGTSSGSLVFKYDASLKFPWYFEEPKPDEDEKLFIKELADEFNLLKKFHKEWNGAIPYHRKRDADWMKTAGKIPYDARLRRDQAKFGNLVGEIPPKKIEEYYNIKDCYYINVGNRGFYALGDSNPYGLVGVPRFADVARATYRSRVANKSGNYNFTLAMEFTIPANLRSLYNIGPIHSSGKSPNIIVKDLHVECFD